MRVKEVNQTIKILEDKLEILDYIVEKLEQIVSFDDPEESRMGVLPNGRKIDPSNLDEILTYIYSYQNEIKEELNHLNNGEVSVVKRKTTGRTG